MKKSLKQTTADKTIERCLRDKQSFFVIAGAGSGKTTSLITALDVIRSEYGKQLRKNGQHIVCVTYTKRAVAVISSRLGWDGLFVVTTLHRFLWDQIKRFNTDIGLTLKDAILPSHISKKRTEDNGGKSQRALAAREKIKELEDHLANIHGIPAFNYGDSNFSDYATGELGHDDVIDVAAHMISTNLTLRRMLGQKYPFIFVDEAQDTHEGVVSALNILCGAEGLPIVGYFGDPMQQIYDKRAGDFKGPANSLRIPKEENFRSSKGVVDLLNAFRSDIIQVPAGPNAETPGSVILRLIQAEAPAAPRARYSPEQSERASNRLDDALREWGWLDRTNVKHLYLVRQMIAGRLNFSKMHKLFSGDYASTRAQDEYENGEHFLLKPFIACLYPLVLAWRTKDHRTSIDVLRVNSPNFDPKGLNAKTSLAQMSKRAETLATELVRLWKSGTVGDVLRYSVDNQLCNISRRLLENLERATRSEQYDETLHASEKGDWLADELFRMPLSEIECFCEFIAERTPFSTQHGVKGEQYSDVLVVFDDIGSAWNNYSFSKTLTPLTAGEPTERQKRLTTNLAYVCFSRAELNLRVVMFTTDALAAQKELIARNLLSASQIEVVTLP